MYVSVDEGMYRRMYVSPFSKHTHLEFNYQRYEFHYGVHLLANTALSPGTLSSTQDEDIHTYVTSGYTICTIYTIAPCCIELCAYLQYKLSTIH